MFINLWQRWLSGLKQRSMRGAKSGGRRHVGLEVEALESRLTPTTIAVSPGDVQGLILAINYLNANPAPLGGTNEIELAAGSTYLLTAPNNYWYGPNGLPAISKRARPSRGTAR